MNALGRTVAAGRTEQVQQLKIAGHDAGQSPHTLADLNGLGIAEGKPQMVLPRPTAGGATAQPTR